MGEDVRVKFFKLDRCGYYRYRSRLAAFGSLHEMLDDIVRWIDGKRISETATYEPTEEQDENLLHTYCYSVRKNRSNDYLLTTWNETSSADGAVASVNLTGTVESADIDTAIIRNGYAPGYPAYFWFPHGIDGFATIQINNRLNGRNNLDEFFRGFLRNFSQWVVLGDPDEETGDEPVLGYSESGKLADLDSAKPYFRAAQWKKNGNLEVIRKRRADIRKLVRRDELNFSFQESVSLWQRIWRNVAGDDPSPRLDGTHRLSLEIDYTPTEDELEKVIQHWEEDQQNVVGQYQDIGFKLHGDQKTHWLSKALASEVVELDVSYADGPLVNSESLLAQLGRKRRQLLTLLEDGIDGE